MMTCLSYSLFYLIWVYPRKVLVLLSMEIFFCCVYYFNCYCFLCSGSNFSFVLLLMILFLVLDSVIGVVLLISISRLSGSHSSFFF